MTRRAALTVFILLPLLALLVLVLASITGHAYLDALVGTIIVVNAVLGALLCTQPDRRTKKYDGSLDVVMDHDREETNLNFSLDPERLFEEGADEVVLKVNFPS